LFGQWTGVPLAALVVLKISGIPYFAKTSYRAVSLSNGCLTVGKAALQPFGGKDLRANPCGADELF
jgi:hypothetical protein